MMLTTFKRTELKFRINKSQFEQLMCILPKHMQSDTYCENNSSYRINNVYYDTQDDLLIRNSLAKPYYKEKLRLRVYGDSIELNSKAFLELKKKTAGIVHKRRVGMSLQEAYTFMKYGICYEEENYIHDQVMNELKFFSKHYTLKPKVYIGYDRIAFFGKEDKNFRITFDYNIMTRRNDFHIENGCYGKRLENKNTYIMEVKFIGSLPKWLINTLSNMRIYKSSFSKYGEEYIKHCAVLKKENPFKISNITFKKSVKKENISQRSYVQC